MRAPRQKAMRQLLDSPRLEHVAVAYQIVSITCVSSKLFP
jgi:hypothetical protein